MQSFFIPLDGKSGRPMYLQIYEYVRDGVLSGQIRPGERLPSLRSAAKNLGVSVTTLSLAYDQLHMEGYIDSRPRSGFFVSAQMPQDRMAERVARSPSTGGMQGMQDRKSPLLVDPECFDFSRWKKCLDRVLTEQAMALFAEAEPRGEEALREEIARYVYRHRGVRSNPSRIILGAGIQPVIEFLCAILKTESIRGLAMEDPGFLPVQKIFAERGFAVTPVPVDREGIRLESLPQNPMHIAYVSPSNQFPTGSVIPVGKRLRLIEWAAASGNYILEDDYDSELRYWGKPIPALQGLDSYGRVVYLGSFSTTLFPSFKISYMILPEELMERAMDLLRDYRQTCSKTEQLALAIYIQSGHYQTHIRKLRRLYGQKIELASSALAKAFPDRVRVLQNSSGVHLLLGIRDVENPDELCRAARGVGLEMMPVRTFSGMPPAGEEGMVAFYYTRIPLAQMEDSIFRLREAWNAMLPVN